MSNKLVNNKSLMQEYNYKKNININPENLSLGSKRKIWWICNKGHEWEASINNRNKGTGCPQCSGRQVIVGYNDLATVNPKLAKEWNYEKNGELKPDMVMANSGKKVWWICKKGHEWEASIDNRSRGRDCPFCANKQLLKGYNDLATINPKLAKEWNYEKNDKLKPDMVMTNSNRKVWWKCNKGHEWQATIYSRNNGNGCPTCAKELQSSFPEQAIYFYIKKAFPDAINGDHHLKMELDIFIPSKKIAIEYDGSFWHKNLKSDERKNKICKENKILLFRVKENIKEESVENDYLRIIPCTYSDAGIKSAIELLVKYLNKKVDVNLDRDRALIYSSFINNQKERSLMHINPNVAKEWNNEKNGELKPDMVMANSGKKVWWICNEGHEWQATITNRQKGSGCPQCSGRQVIIGYNDLATVNPKLSKEWNNEKNGELKPDMVMANSGKKVWWICSKRHEWQAIIRSRNNGAGCPICANQQILKGYNDLATVNPKLSKEWNNEKNGELKPDMVMANSNKKVWWICNEGHEWQASIVNRNRGNSCPKCIIKKR